MSRTLAFALHSGAGNTFAVATSTELGGRAGSLVAREVCRERGLDGLLEVRPVKAAEGCELRMVVWNADGSRAEACGNGLRCVAAFARERGLVASDRMRVVTDVGPREVELVRPRDVGTGRAVAARASLGHPTLVERAARIELGAGAVLAALVDVGNPHCVVFGAERELERLPQLGPALASHPLFAQGTNVELAWVEPVDGPFPARWGSSPGLLRSRIRARVFERGVGETAACGTGAVAVAFAAGELGLATLPAAVALPGGTLEVALDERGEAWLAGPIEDGSTPPRTERP